MKDRDEALRIGKLALTRAKEKYGKAYALLGEDIQEALVMREAAYIVLCQGMEIYEPAQELLQGAIAAFEETK